MNKLLIILIVTLVLVALGVGGYFLFKKSGDSISETPKKKKRNY